jgi:hypothetical protein
MRMYLILSNSVYLREGCVDHSTGWSGPMAQPNLAESRMRRCTSHVA